MAYNGGFPMTYQPMYPVYQPAQQAQPTPQVNQPVAQNNPMIWVQGETGAKSYLLAPNTTLPLWDSESQTIYLKSSDASGMPSMKILDYTIREQNTNQQNATVVPVAQGDFVTHKELADLREEIASKIEGLRSTPRKHRKEEEDEEA